LRLPQARDKHGGSAGELQFLGNAAYDCPMRGFVMRMLLAASMAASAAVSAHAQQTVSVGGVSAVLLKPGNAPAGSLILLAGGDGHLGIGPNGTIGHLRGNQLVRTRHAYVERGFAVLLPDADVDLAAAVKYMGGIARPVTVVGTSRGTQRAAEGIARGARPDALVLTAGFLSPQSGERVNRHVIALLGGSPSILPRTLVIHHRQDSCRHTLPGGVKPFLEWSKGKASVVWLDGGVNIGDPCQARAWHGFNGLDDKVVEAVASFARR
jgi:hypothetical protein